MALPANVGYGKVEGRFLRAIADSSDPGPEPDGEPVPGLKVKFSASVARAKNASAVPPVTIELPPVTVTCDEDGFIVDEQGNPGVYLVASEDPDLNPTGWTYSATIEATNVKPYTFSFPLPVDAVVDLATVIPVPADPGAELADWIAVVATTEEARDDALAAASDAEAAAAGVTPPLTSVRFVDGTNGDDGNDGRSAARAFATIQAAIDVLTTGGTVLVAPGVYDPFTVTVSGVHVQSTGGRRDTIIATTSLTDSGVTFLGASALSTIVQCGLHGFTITGPGKASGGTGVGVDIKWSSVDLTIEDCWINEWGSHGVRVVDSYSMSFLQIGRAHV